LTGIKARICQVGDKPCDEDRAAGMASRLAPVGRERRRAIPMYKNLLFATDGSELADKGVTQGLALAKALGARVTVVTVSEPWTAFIPGEVGATFPVEEYEQAINANASAVLGSVAKRAAVAGVACAERHVKDQFPAEGIIEAAKKDGCDLIVMASHGRSGVQRLLLGSQANKVVTQSTIPVLVCR
jgi:nucleotide-binding universal stress UspA family protein